MHRAENGLEREDCFLIVLGIHAHAARSAFLNVVAASSSSTAAGTLRALVFKCPWVFNSAPGKPRNDPNLPNNVRIVTVVAAVSLVAADGA